MDSSTRSGSGDNVASTPGQGPVAPQGTGVRGRVTDPSGAPVELATLTVAPSSESDGPVTQEANVTDAGGRYFLPLPVGEWKVTITARGYGPATLAVEVGEDQQVRRDIVLQPAKG